LLTQVWRLKASSPLLITLRRFRYVIATSELVRDGSPYLNSTVLPEWYTFTDHWESSIWQYFDIAESAREYSSKILKEMLTEYELLPRTHHEKPNLLYGALTMNGEVFRTAERIRAMHAALEFLPSHRSQSPGYLDVEAFRNRVMLRERVERTARRAAEYLATLQVTFNQNPLKGGFVRAASRMKIQVTAEAEEFNLRINEIRIDYVLD